MCKLWTSSVLRDVLTGHVAGNALGKHLNHLLCIPDK